MDVSGGVREQMTLRNRRLSRCYESRQETGVRRPQRSASQSGRAARSLIEHRFDARRLPRMSLLRAILLRLIAGVSTLAVTYLGAARCAAMTPPPNAAASAPPLSSQAVHECALHKSSRPVTIIAGPDGNLWFTEETDPPPRTKGIGRISVRGVLLSPITRGLSPQGTIDGHDLVRANDRNAFFVENLQNGYRIGRVTAAGTITDIYRGKVPETNPGVVGFVNAIAVAPNGYVWLTQSNGRFARIDSRANITEFKPKPGTSASGLTVGPDGSVWVTEESLKKTETAFIARFIPDGTMKIFPLLPDTNPVNTTVGPDGNLWFVDFFHDRIGRLNPADGRFTEFILPARSGPAKIVTGPDEKLWFTQLNDRIGQITTNGAIKNFQSGIRPNAGVIDIALGADGNLWFTESRADCIGRITPDGVVTEF